MTTTLRMYFNRERTLEELNIEAATLLIGKNPVTREGETLEQYEARIIKRARARVKQNFHATKTRGMVLCHLRHEYTNYDEVLASIEPHERARVRLDLQAQINVEAQRVYPFLSRFNLLNPANTAPLFLAKNVVWEKKS